MRLLLSTPAFVAAGALVWGCAVYDSALVPTDSGLAGTGDTSSTGGKSGSAGSTTSTAGKTSSAGRASEGGDTAMTTGGTNAQPGDGGEANSEAGQSMGGTLGVSGSAGAASKAGSGGVATGGTASGGKGGTASGGSGGSGGSAPVVAKCADHALTTKTTWVATASSESLGTGVETDGLYNPAVHMTDGSYTERWSSGKPQSGDEWIQIDFGATVNITSLTLNPNNDTGDYPRAYAVRISTKSGDFTVAAKATGVGMPGSTVVTFPAIIGGRYLTVRQTGADVDPDNAWWTIAEVLATCTDS